MENTEIAAMSKSRVGRPAKAEHERQALVPVRFPPDLIERLDAEIEVRGDGLSRSALIREYVARGLSASERKRLSGFRC